MRVYHSLAEVPDSVAAGRVVAIGVFDGVHRGHQEILRRAVEVARAAGAVSLDELEKRGRECVLAMSAVVPSCFPVWHVTHEQARAVGSGLRIDYDGPAVEEPVAVVGPDGRFVAMAADEGGRARYLAVFVPAASKSGS